MTWTDIISRDADLSPDLVFAAKNYDLIYNDFIDFTLELNSGSYIAHLTTKNLLRRTKAEWGRYQGNSEQRTYNYSLSTFTQCIRARTNVQPEHLENTVLDWIGRDDVPAGLAILGSYGTGKSSLARRIAFKCADLYTQDQLLRIPFLIELKEFGSHQDIRGLITHELVNRHGVANGSFETFQSLNKAGRFILILDGFDEMKQGVTLDTLLFNFNQLALLHTQKSSLLFGRPTLFESQAEQNRILKGDIPAATITNARYIHIGLAPLQEPEISTLLVRYTEAKYPKLLPRVKNFVRRLQRALRVRGNDDLADLVSRPVHLPMLVSLLQRRAVDPSRLKRSILYREFISAIIEREMLKRRHEFQHAYSAKARIAFAQKLAVEMWRRGESRSIKTGGDSRQAV